MSMLWCSAVLSLALSCAAFAEPQCSMTPVNLRCEYRTDPVGIASTAPRLSWQLAPREERARGLVQSAYQIIVASRPDRLTEAHADLWNTGPRRGQRSAQIEYTGRLLTSREQAWWTVRIWDENGTLGEFAAPQRWSMGLLSPQDWTATWIGLDAQPAPPLDMPTRTALKNLPWLAAGNAIERTPQTATFSQTFTLAALPKHAFFAGTVDQLGSLRVNGAPLAALARWEPISAIDLTASLRSGSNTIDIEVIQEDGFAPAVSGIVFLDHADGTSQRIATDAAWTVSLNGASVPPRFDRARPWGGNRNTEHFMAPATYLRRDFLSQPALTRATLYAAARGVYHCEINGQRVGDQELAPGWTDYAKRIYHQTYDVTHLIRPGSNAIGVVLGDGWYAGLAGYTGRRGWYGASPRFLGQLELEYADGSRRVINSDHTWWAATGPILWNDLYLGCGYDSRREMPGWSSPGFSTANWRAPAQGISRPPPRRVDVTARLHSLLQRGTLPMRVNNDHFGDPAYGVVKSLDITYTLDDSPHTLSIAEGGALSLPASLPPEAITSATYGEPLLIEPVIEPQPGEPVRRFETLVAKSVTQPRPGRFVYDLGQNIVGFPRLTILGTSGQRIVVRHGEMLNPDGTLYTSNLRGATATDFFWLSGQPQALEPAFTFHGFRYVEITGLDKPVPPSSVVGVVLHTDMPRTGTFECSNPLVNQLFSNIIWGQKGNYLEVPTDCPQRDERLGWTGDAQFFFNTAAYNFDISGFMSRWLKTLVHDSQFEDGTFAHVAPKLNERGGSTAWGDAAIVCTHAMYRRYGDLRLVRDNYAPMKAYMAWLEPKTQAGITTVGGFGDWLNLNDPTESKLIDTAYRIELLSQMTDMANWLGHAEDAAAFTASRAEALSAFSSAFKLPAAALKDSGQTGYALAYTMNLLSKDESAAYADAFALSLQRKNNHLATGFIGTPRLLIALHNAGRDDLAYRLLLNETYPSWLYQVKLGATTMWERWDGWTPEKGFADVGMNSFNHYAFGSVGDYLFSVVAGITYDAAADIPITLAPVPGPGLDFARATYDSPGGPIASAWKRLPGGVEYAFTIPPNHVARVMLPGVAAPVRELHSGEDIDLSPPLPSGTYLFFVADSR